MPVKRTSVVNCTRYNSSSYDTDTHASVDNSVQ